jgi:hypothetical protein
LVIDVDVALLLQQQLAVSLGLGENATIFEICAAINATGGFDNAEVIALLEAELGPIVTAQINIILTQILETISTLLFGGGPIPPGLITSILDRIDIDSIVAQITANVEVSLGILEACLGLEVNGAGIAPPQALTGLQLPTIQQMNPTIQQNSQVLPSGDPMLQLQSSLSPIL